MWTRGFFQWPGKCFNPFAWKTRWVLCSTIGWSESPSCCSVWRSNRLLNGRSQIRCCGLTLHSLTHTSAHTSAHTHAQSQTHTRPGNKWWNMNMSARRDPLLILIKGGNNSVPGGRGTSSPSIWTGGVVNYGYWSDVAAAVSQCLWGASLIIRSAAKI